MRVALHIYRTVFSLRTSMKSFLLSLLLLSGTCVYAQKSPEAVLNLDFETRKDALPADWFGFKQKDGYEANLDSTVVHSGKYSARISCTQNCNDFKALGLNLPSNYPGRKITLTGWIRTENVTGGYAGLWMRIDPRIGFDNMQDRGIKGTNDWKKYSITLELEPQLTKNIVVGALLVGGGKMWVDDMEIRIDGKMLKDVKPILTKSFPADKDTVFATHSPVPVMALPPRKLGYFHTLGLVWGFLKYYHPAISEGRYNWDNELFRFLPQYIAAVEDTPGRNSMLYAWVKGLGTFETATPAAVKEAKLLPDLDWIQTSGFSPQLRDLLLQVKDAKRPNENYYVGLAIGAQNPLFQHEREYETAQFPDAGMQLLALYRYWNMVQHFFPYKNLIEEDWKGVLAQMIPRFIGAKTVEEYTFAAQEAIGRIHDTHANVWGNNEVMNAFFGKRYPPLKMTMIDSQLVVKSYAPDSLGKLSGLKPGDVITRISGQPVKALLQSHILRYPASNSAALLRDFADDALRSNDSVLQVSFLRNGQVEETTLSLYSQGVIYGGTKASKDSMFQILPGNIALVNNGLLQRADLSKIWPKLKDTRALIIDDRNYPSDFPIHDFCNYLLPKPTIFYLATKPFLAQPGTFAFEAPQPTGRKNKNHYKGKVVILVNEETQSSAEFHAMAYQTHPDAKVIGSTTAGADGNVSEIVLPGDIKTMFSGIGIYYPDGRETQRTGVAIDIVAKPTAAGIAAGKDEVLERALEYINTGK